MNVCDLLLSNKVATVSTDALAIYLLMRADIEKNSTVTAKFFKHQNKLATGYGVQSIASVFQIPIFTVSRAIEQLLRNGWIKQVRTSDGIVYQLGDIKEDSALWFIRQDRKLNHSRTPSSIIKKYVKEKKEREIVQAKPLSRQARIRVAEKVIEGVDIERNPSKKILNYFIMKYADTFDAPFLVVEKNDDAKEYSKAIMFVKRYFSYCDSNYSYAIQLLDFIFDKWESIGKKLDWVGLPNLSFIGTHNIIKMMRRWKKEGIPNIVENKDRVAKRFDKISAKEAPDVGF